MPIIKKQPLTKIAVYYQEASTNSLNEYYISAKDLSIKSTESLFWQTAGLYGRNATRMKSKLAQLKLKHGNLLTITQN